MSLLDHPNIIQMYGCGSFKSKSGYVFNLSNQINFTILNFQIIIKISTNNIITLLLRE